MDLIVFIILLFLIYDYKESGRLLARIRLWADYYHEEELQKFKKQIAKLRLKRIRKKYPYAFRSKNF